MNLQTTTILSLLEYMEESSLKIIKEKTDQLLKEKEEARLNLFFYHNDFKSFLKFEPDLMLVEIDDYKIVINENILAYVYITDDKNVWYIKDGIVRGYNQKGTDISEELPENIIEYSSFLKQKYVEYLKVVFPD